MIRSGSKLNVADNSGAKMVQCIQILNGSCQKAATIGDEIVVAIKSANTGGIVKEGDTSKAVIVRTKKEISRYGGIYVRFSDNAVVLVNDNGEIKGSRIFGPVGEEVKKNGKYNKIISLAPEVI